MRVERVECLALAHLALGREAEIPVARDAQLARVGGEAELVRRRELRRALEHRERRGDGLIREVRVERAHVHDGRAAAELHQRGERGREREAVVVPSVGRTASPPSGRAPRTACARARPRARRRTSRPVDPAGGPIPRRESPGGSPRRRRWSERAPRARARRAARRSCRSRRRTRARGGRRRSPSACGRSARDRGSRGGARRARRGRRSRGPRRRDRGAPSRRARSTGVPRARAREGRRGR